MTHAHDGRKRSSPFLRLREISGNVGHRVPDFLWARRPLQTETDRATMSVEDVEDGGLLEESILSSLGEEVTSIVAPVTACMALTVCLVRTLYLGRDNLSTSPTSIARRPRRTTP